MGLAKWDNRVVELYWNASVKECKIYERKPIRRGVLSLTCDAQLVQALSDLSMLIRYSRIWQNLSTRSLCSLKHRFGQ